MATKWKLMTQKKCQTNEKYRFFPFSKQKTEENYQILFLFFFIVDLVWWAFLCTIIFLPIVVLMKRPFFIYRLLLFVTSNWKLLLCITLFYLRQRVRMHDFLSSKYFSRGAAAKGFHSNWMRFFSANHQLHLLESNKRNFYP